MLNPGTKLGPYEIVSPLGAGGMGEVYRARDSRLRREVAVKILPKAISSDPDRLRRFEQEALATAALNHPNILAVFDIGAQDGSPYVVSELLEGETLRDRLKAGAIPMRRALDFALQIAHGLAAAHEKGIIHRDLKPENLFVTKDGRVKILDFGLAKLTQTGSGAEATLATMSHGTEAGVVLGTAGYMSPEQVRGQALDARSDIFSFGAILYEMLSGKRAFHGETPADTMSSILKEEPAELSTTNQNVPPALERIVHHCLEKNPESRFHSASDIGFDLEHLSEISAGSAKVAPVGASAGRPGRKTMVGVAIGFALAAIAFIAGWKTGEIRAYTPPPEYARVTFRKGTMGNARFTPDGSIVYNAAWDGGDAQLYVARVDDPNAREVGIKDAEILAVSRNGELAVRLNSKHTRGLDVIGTLARVSLSGGTPREVLDDVMDADWAADGEHMAVARHMAENDHWHIEYPIGKVLVDSINWLSSPRISPDGKWIAFADHENNSGDDQGSIAVIPADGSGQEKKLSTGWEAIEGLAWGPSGDEVWFASTMAGFATDPRAVTLSGKVRRLTNAPSGMMLQDVQKDRMLVVSHISGRGIRALTPGSTQEREMGWFGWAILADVSRDGKKILSFDVGEAGGSDYIVFLRDVDGSPPLTLGTGKAECISPDGKWVVTQPAQGGSLNLVPTGAGQARALTHDSVSYTFASYLPDGKSLLAAGIEAGHGARNYLVDIATGGSKPISPEGIYGTALSPDGKSAAVLGPDGKWNVWPLNGDAASLRPIPGLESTYSVRAWTSEGNSVYVASHGNEKVGKIYKVDVSSGKMELWKTIGADAGADVTAIFWPLIFDDGNGYAYGYQYDTAQAYVVTGLK
ncbi:MAG TPA: protein kinase [Terriglobales bacterium]